MKDEKIKVMNEIQRAFEHARELGYQVVVASDEEANNFNSIECGHFPTFYEDTKENVIAISVVRFVSDDEVFNTPEVC